VRLFRDDTAVGDLLFASSCDGAIGKWVPRPHRLTGETVTLSGLLPYATTTAPHRRVVLGGTVTPPPGVTWETMIASDTPPAAVRIWSAEPLRVPRFCGRLDGFIPGSRTPGATIRFNPWHAPPGLRPAGLINKLRDPAYRGSQQGRSAEDSA